MYTKRYIEIYISKTKKEEELRIKYKKNWEAKLTSRTTKNETCIGNVYFGRGFYFIFLIIFFFCVIDKSF